MFPGGGGGRGMDGNIPGGVLFLALAGLGVICKSCVLLCRLVLGVRTNHRQIIEIQLRLF